MKDTTCLWLIGQNEFGLYPLDIGEDTLAEQITDLREALLDDWGSERGLKLPGKATQQQKERKSFVQRSHELYSVLIPEAVRPLLIDQSALGIIPTGSLYTLSFELLLTRLPPPCRRLSSPINGDWLNGVRSMN